MLVRTSFPFDRVNHSRRPRPLHSAKLNPFSYFHFDADALSWCVENYDFPENKLILKTRGASTYIIETVSAIDHNRCIFSFIKTQHPLCELDCCLLTHNATTNKRQYDRIIHISHATTSKLLLYVSNKLDQWFISLSNYVFYRFVWIAFHVCVVYPSFSPTPTPLWRCHGVSVCRNWLRQMETNSSIHVAQLLQSIICCPPPTVGFCATLIWSSVSIT